MKYNPYQQFKEVIAELLSVEQKSSTTLLFTSKGILKIHKWQWDYLNSLIGLYILGQVKFYWWVDQNNYVYSVATSRNANPWTLPRSK